MDFNIKSLQLLQDSHHLSKNHTKVAINQMDSLNNLETLENQSTPTWVDDWAFTEYSKPPKSQTNPENMLQNFSNNLLTYENSYKKQIKKITFLPQSTQNLKKRKIKKRSLNFSNLENIQPNNITSKQTNKQNETIQIIEARHKQSKENENLENNMTKLEKMFKILQSFESFNDSILPSKVNLNKISHKRILANVALKDNIQKTLPDEKGKTQTILIAKNLESSKVTFEMNKITLENEFVPLKNRVYSLDFQSKHLFNKRNSKVESDRLMGPICNNVFSLNGQNYSSKKIKSSSMSKRKTMQSIRRSENAPCEKSIEEIRANNYMAKKWEKQNIYRKGVRNETQIREVDLKEKGKNFKTQITGKEGLCDDNFSDSRFFSRRQGLTEIKLGSINNISRR